MKALFALHQDLFEEIRRLHNHLRWLGDEVHAEWGMTSVMRSLLLSLHREEGSTVPDLARERRVSRQIIQTQINLLLREGWVERRANPRHRRSQMMVLSRKGKTLVERMLAREADLLREAGSPLSEAELRKTCERLSRFRRHLESRETGD